MGAAFTAPSSTSADPSTDGGTHSDAEERGEVGQYSNMVADAETLKARETIMNICSTMYVDTPCLIDTVLHIFLELSTLRLDYEGKGRDDAEEGNCETLNNIAEYWARRGARVGPAPCVEEARRQYRDGGGQGNREVENNPDQQRGRRTPLINMTSVSCRAKLAFALMEGLARQNTPRSPFEIAARLDVLPKHILAVETKCCTPVTYTCPSLYMERACAFLELPFYVGALARKLCERVQDDFYGFHPQALVGATIMAIISAIRIKEKTPSMFGHMSLESISETLGVSVNAARSCYRRLPLFKLRRKFWRGEDIGIMDTTGHEGESGTTYIVDEFVKKRSPYVLCDSYP